MSGRSAEAEKLEEGRDPSESPEVAEGAVCRAEALHQA
jgi:hypothetical protein